MDNTLIVMLGVLGVVVLFLAWGAMPDKATKLKKG